MGIVATENRYVNAVRELFPKGSFFEAEFENQESDLSRLVKLKGKEIYNFKNKMKELSLEAVLTTCTEKTIADWERVYTNDIRDDLSLPERKILIQNHRNNILDIETLNTAASLYDAKIEKIVYPIRPSRFGVSRFGQTRIFDLKVLNVVYIYASIARDEKKELFQKAITSIMLANTTIYFKYNTTEENNVYVSR